MSGVDVGRDGFKLVEEYSGTGEVSWRDKVFTGIEYRVSRFQGMSRSGLPIPGLHRIEGSIDLDAVPRSAELVDGELTLRLQDGRTLRVTLAGHDGRVLAEGHGPSRCSCC